MSRWVLLLVLLLACSSAVAPPEREALRAGTYAYVSHVSGNDYSGTITFDHVSDDSVHAIIRVSGLRADVDLGFRSGDAYVLYVHLVGNARILVHRVTPTLSCRVFELDAGAGTCSIR
jgi:hypothetical protein